ncbi:hypothetical protein [Hymenobacter cavernae]|uniref:Uncharacterized protein n=1 Tax=Hymenobacter cavernae TaxID=2044852 RepID=A0ABQ1UEM9_9BACT|nr:hypothetical protein [Hymenobacter cavernae]GGF17331.1 hypothetical protein GCM10011383_30940 [Hymenobacter cavernae]
MEKIPLKVWNRIVMLQAPIAAEIPIADARYRRWIEISPNYQYKAVGPPVPNHEYSICDTVFDIELLRIHEPHGDEDLALVSQSHYYVSNEDELYQQLAELNVDPTLFNSPWRVEHPYYS